jgi:nitroimidazol reductase NimA-like FMN-containing flavoprotein (pyridoxamine 5'-phosphate oxidase superfamily)
MDRSDPTAELGVTDRTRLRRSPERGSRARSDLYDILDAGFVCHLGVATDEGPKVFPTVFGRDGDRLYLHGSVASRSLRAARDDAPMCVTVTHVDGVVLARSVFAHSMNYRSAMVFGTPRTLVEREEKRTAMRIISDHIAPGQWGYAREPSDEELAVTTVLVLDLDEASVKIRRGPPGDGQGPDADRAVWAGEIPLRTVRLEPVPDPAMRTPVEIPPHIARRGPAAGLPPGYELD